MTNSALAIHGVGAVTPGGLGWEALIHLKPWPFQVLSSLKNPEKKFHVNLVNPIQERLKHWQKEPRLRRASMLSLFIMEAASQALAATSFNREKMGIIVALHTGCIVYSRRFFQGILEQGQRFASPALFPETVFNSPVSHVASILGINGACYTIVGDSTAWVTALHTARTWLELKEVESVLVVGAEELDLIALEAYAQAGWLSGNASFLPAEGAGAVLLTLAREKDIKILTQIQGGCPYRNRSQAKVAAQNCFKNINSHSQVLCSASQTALAEIEKECSSPFFQILTPLTWGQAFTASASWQTIYAMHQLSEEKPLLFQPVWGLNHQISALEFQYDYGKVKNASSESR